MTADSFAQLLILYGWFMLAGLVVFVILIARFYQRFAGEPTHYRLFIVPILLFGIRAVREANVPDDPLADILAAVAGVMLIILSIALYRRMTVGRN